ncbi:acyl-CoA N-acyltransferase [Rickenella mellea]|uniref:histone acetyltransferase n=1 Tax=Rickenella mellea TaxID=50990 RepID=A0A4Y7QNA1_9AGAM|nr:acyl-CoA N-acyltransferase [Rickenella mellea]
MPRKNVAVRGNGDESKVYAVTKNGVQTQAYVMQRRPGEVYVHYANADKRLDEWLPEKDVVELATNGTNESRKRKRGMSSADASRDPSVANGSVDGRTPESREDVPMTEEEIDLREHRKITATRNFDKVIFGTWEIKTWYYSPYPLSDAEADDTSNNSGPSHKGSAVSSSMRIHNVPKTSVRAHGRTSDLLAGGLSRNNASAEKSNLWVCDRCFKYMRDGSTLELHKRGCEVNHPPGRKVYSRGAHSIWEVDGAKEKLFCQNLSLFGKLFIDIKTLFFDSENFVFYLMTDADSKRDHVLGFFSKEKVSYDDYNLACIVTLPPYQRQGFGMLMIEFSYELSRRAGKIGTPERPLSDLGLRSYLAYWIATLVRFFRPLLSVVPAETPEIIYKDQPNTELLRSLLKSDNTRSRKKSNSKGWHGEKEIDPKTRSATPREIGGTTHALSINEFACISPAYCAEPMNSLRTARTTLNPDGSATTHLVVKCTLADISKATFLREDDVAFALNECGLLTRRARLDGKDGTEDVIAISREMVEAVATERKVKPTCIDLRCVEL